MKFSKIALSTVSAAVLGFLALGIASTPAGAATTATTTFDVTATVLTNCTVSAAPLPFLNYTGVALAVTGTGITVTCSNGTPYTVGLDLGKHSSGTNRFMMNTTDNLSTLGYSLFSDSIGTPWGNTTGTMVSGTGTGAAQTPLKVYGQIPQGEAVVAGSYSDTIGVTVTY